MTNVVVFDVSESGVPPAEMSARLKQRGVMMNAINERCVRAVTHYDVDRAQCAQAVEAVAVVVGEAVAVSIATSKTS
jgi:threonine aldolase